MPSVATGASPSYPIVCSRCGGSHYSNPVPLVSCVIFSNDKVLLIRRAKPPFLGRWAPPGGYINHKESVDDAAIREVYEETGIRLNPNHLIPYSVASIRDINQIYIIFRIHLEHMPDTTASEEVMNIAWFAEKELPVDEFWLPAHMPSFRSIFTSMKTNRFKFYVNESSYSCSTSRSFRMREEPTSDPKSANRRVGRH